MSTLLRWSLPLVLCSMSTLSAQGPDRQPGSDGDNQPSQPSQAPQQSPNNSGLQNSDASSGPRNQNAARRNQAPLDVESGAIPELFSRDQDRLQGRGQSGQQSNRGNRRRSDGDRTGSSREFIQNALKFDANSDQQLAANELANLFHVLASSQRNQRHNDGHPPQQGHQGGQNLQPARPVTQTTRTTTSSSTGTGTSQADANFIQRQSVREALLLFLQLSLQFDTNGDGLLSQAELRGLATALLNNDMGLLNAATQSGGRRATQQNRTQTTTTTTSQVNQRNPGQQKPRRGGPNGGRPNGEGTRPGRENGGRPTEGQGSSNGRPTNNPPQGGGSNSDRTNGTTGGGQRTSSGPQSQ